ncbi:globin-coupled sensor protein [Paenibacillus sp. DMB20]|uniref:globin-coupled sensor protein n=1 Tax=Paenibacillus sp. DMB20 TaxID=1642570 RepID=UPI000627F93D|nr:globin-coupled sensor protein [Paenibacillus sp. DMB20]KKO53637.1 chemotaxis protein [Paenibacillus sp. DMB20]
MIDVSPERRQQLEYLGLHDKDLLLLANHRGVFSKVVEEVVNRFYNQIETQPNLMQIIGRTTTVERLKETQRVYWMSLADGIVDNAYIENRIKIGQIHSRVGLTTDYYLGSYMVYLDIAADLLKQAVPDGWIHAVHALSKMFNLDSQLVLEAYNLKEKEKIQALAGEQEKMLEAITAAVQELTAMIVELDQSAAVMSENAMKTAEAQEKAHALTEELNQEILHIEQMGTLIREISDQSHLLGLNAAIEAAHAGEFGRGFEVVAGEVRKLANHSRQAMEQIQGKVSGIIRKLEQVEHESEQTSINARNQAASSQELAAFVKMMEKLAGDLDALQHGASAKQEAAAAGR